MALSGLSVLDRNNVRYILCKLASKPSRSFQWLSLIKYSIFITTDEFKLLNRAKWRSLERFSLRPTELKLKKSETRLERLFNNAELQR